MTLSHQEEYYRALLNKDSQYLGVFFACVKTTGIFCVSTCTARKPKQENVWFVTNAKEALQHGYRPCKVCKPLKQSEEPPAFIKQLLDQLAKAPHQKIGDAEIRALGGAPEQVRRWFNKHHGITFQAYQRMIRLNTAYHYLQQGEAVTQTAFASGYGSLSGFGSAFKNIFGVAPEGSDMKTRIHLHRFETQLGPMYVGATDEGICLLEFTDRRMLETEFEDLKKRLDATILPGENQWTKAAEAQVAAYFKGELQIFDLPLVTPGTPFQQEVWSALCDIPFGKTKTYKAQAEYLGNPDAVRAVARANGMNRIAIVIPCHRVIGADGKLTGYAGGLARKEWLLRHEGAIQGGLF